MNADIALTRTVSIAVARGNAKWEPEVMNSEHGTFFKLCKWDFALHKFITGSCRTSRTPYPPVTQRFLGATFWKHLKDRREQAAELAVKRARMAVNSGSEEDDGAGEDDEQQGGVERKRKKKAKTCKSKAIRTTDSIIAGATVNIKMPAFVFNGAAMPEIMLTLLFQVKTKDYWILANDDAVKYVLCKLMVDSA